MTAETLNIVRSIRKEQSSNKTNVASSKHIMTTPSFFFSTCPSGILSATYFILFMSLYSYGHDCIKFMNILGNTNHAWELAYSRSVFAPVLDKVMLRVTAFDSLSVQICFSVDLHFTTLGIIWNTNIGVDLYAFFKVKGL